MEAKQITSLKSWKGLVAKRRWEPDVLRDGLVIEGRSKQHALRETVNI